MTKDNSPNSLRPKPQAKEVTKKYLYLAVFMFVIIFCVYVYNVSTSGVKAREGQAESVGIDETEENKMFILADGSGLALKDEEDQESGIIQAPQNPTHQTQEPIVIVRDSPEEMKIDEEYENIKKMRTQNYLTALSSPIISKQYGSSENTQNNQAAYIQQGSSFENPQVNPLATSLNTSQSSYDPSADKDKEDFFSRSQPDKAWISMHIRTKGQDFEVKTGSVIPAIMVTGINSDLPGHIIAQVSQNVYDTATGMNMLIPQGSKLFGVYNSRIVYGQERVLVAWNRIIFPDGSALTLPAMEGADLSGNSGFSDRVNNHYFKTFGSAILMSLITAGTSYALDISGAMGDESSLQSQLTASLAQQIGETSAQLLEKNLNIKPTLEIRTGYQFNVVLTKDLVFQSPYTAWK